MSIQQRTEPTQLSLMGGAPAERWLTLPEALELFVRAGAEETVLLARIEEGTIRSRISNQGVELHPVDFERWVMLEGRIAEGLRNNGHRR